VIQHHSFTKTIQSELRSIVSCPTRERILSSQATYIDDVAALPVPHPWQSFLRTVESTRQIRFQRFGPIVHTQLRRALEDSDSRIVHKDVQPPELAIYKLKETRNLCAIPYIGCFSYHFTFRRLGQLCYGIFHTCVTSATDSYLSACCRQRFGDSESYATAAAGDDCVLAFEKCIHTSMLIRI
jgi:hypothetical protein